MNTNKIHIYHGDGKGKTSACIGLAIRAAGAGYNIVFVQFLKGKPSSEFVIINNIKQIHVINADISNKFTFQMNENELSQTKEKQNELLLKAVKICNELQNEKHMIILDEVFGALSTNTLSEELVKAALKTINAEIVLSGRNPPQDFIDAADYVSEIKKIKHPYEIGLAARHGIEN